MEKNFKILPGTPQILGSTLMTNGVNFAIFSRHAESIRLVIFENFEDKEPIVDYDFDLIYNKTGDIWHVFVENIKVGMSYVYSIDAEFLPEYGQRYNPNKFLIDPYAKLVKLKCPLDKADAFAYSKKGQANTFSLKNNINKAPRSIIVETKGFTGIKSPNTLLKNHIIYELNINGFTKHKSSEVEHAGTFLGLVEKIPYLKELGVTAVEVLPVHIFDEKSIIRINQKGENLTQYWGYDPLAFMALHIPYASTDDPQKAIDEFKYMVSELHKAGIDIFLDVVFNHTVEGNEYGPTISFKGIDNQIYYMLDNGGMTYKNYSGCGNTVNCNHPVVKDLIIDTLLYWVIEMGVDGFRFDEASILARDKYGNILDNSPLVERISENPILRDKIIIAEAWDARGAYQVGSFGSARWAEWNGKFRDDIRSFVKSDYGTLRLAAERLMGSRDLYLMSLKNPENSINFITCHDGFTMEDLVSYNEKHNEDNGENSMDGENHNISWNCGVEGKTKNKDVLSLREQQKKNMMTLLMFSLGVPMLLAGDEFGNTQGGNNNAYCQNNEISWLDWSKLKKNQSFFRFVKNIISFRKRTPVLRVNHYYRTTEGISSPVEWFGEKGKAPNWSSNNFNVACLIKSQDKPILKEKSDEIFMILNMHWEQHLYKLPKIKNKKWYFLLDTSNKSPYDIVDNGKEYILKNQKQYTIKPRSIAVFVAKKS